MCVCVCVCVQAVTQEQRTSVTTSLWANERRGRLTGWFSHLGSRATPLSKVSSVAENTVVDADVQQTLITLSIICHLSIKIPVVFF